MSESVRQYWEERAGKYATASAATTDDVYLRELECRSIIQAIQQFEVARAGKFLDVGCGDGYSTLRVAEAFPDLQFCGIDYAEGMIRLAEQRLEVRPGLKHRVVFRLGNVLRLEEACGDSLFEIVLTDRCLINLGSHEDQSNAIARIAEHTREGAFYIAIENFIEGHENMNKARATLGLPEIPVRWHNLYFRREAFATTTHRFFEPIAEIDFSSAYYFATRVIYSRMCQMCGETPDYRHEIHQLAVDLPWFGQFSPIRMFVFRRKGA